MKSMFLAVLVAAILLAGCPAQNTNGNQAPPPAQSGVKDFNVLIAHTGYSPGSFSVNKGDKVRFFVVAAPGTSWHGHGISIDEYDVNTVVRSEDSGAPVVIQLTADKAGTFKIYCKTCNAQADSWKAKTGTEHPPIQATLTVK